MIPGESSRSEAVSTKAKYTAMHSNEMEGSEVEESSGVKVEDERTRTSEGERRAETSVVLGATKDISTREAAEGATKRKQLKHRGESSLACERQSTSMTKI